MGLRGLFDRMSARGARLFRDREFMYYSAEAGMRVVRLSRRVQIAAVCGTALLLTYAGGATAAWISADGAGIAQREAEVRALRTEVARMKNDIALTAARIESRQAFIGKVIEGDADITELAAIIPAQISGPADQPLDASILAPLMRLESRQLAFVGEAAERAETQYERQIAALRRMGLRTRRFAQQTEIPMGGPDVKLDGGDTDPLAAAEPGLKDLLMSWKKLELLEDNMNSIPNAKPAKNFRYTSRYGVRFDPFKGTAALHQGVDLAGRVGEPILSTAPGRIVKAGRHGGYGKFVEIDHGKGIATRYAHMSRLHVKVGDRVGRGEKIGGMGSTGRSTGSHLHYEIRVDGRAVDPMPFLEAADYAFDARGAAARGGPEGD